jgi:hypothetical protein
MLFCTIPALQKWLFVPCGLWPCNRASKSSLRAASSCFSRSVGCLFCILVDRMPEGDRTPSLLSSPPFGNVIDIESRAGSARAFAVTEPQTDSSLLARGFLETDLFFVCHQRCSPLDS